MSVAPLKSGQREVAGEAHPDRTDADPAALGQRPYGQRS
jgi:hypothetical protein